MYSDIQKLLGDKAEYLLGFNSPKISKEALTLPGADFIDRVYAKSNRSNTVLNNLARIWGHGRLANTGLFSILPWTRSRALGGASFAKNPAYFDPENIIKLAIEAVAMRGFDLMACWR
jgi:class I fructose-bisphosphate aldolase